MMQVLDLFSGIGGFSLGLERAGMKTVAFCEPDKYCQKVLARHWPSVPCYSDIRSLNACNIPKSINLICGGYPCQPFSVAGKRTGAKDDRHLWPSMFRLVAELRPTWVLCENVAGHITMGLDTVLSDLENENYTAQTLVIPACSVNAPHRRNRVWIIAHANSTNWRPWANVSSISIESPAKFAKSSSQKRKAASDTDSAGRSQLSAKQGRSADIEQQTIQGGNHWESKPPVYRVDDGISGRLDSTARRIKHLGNAVVPQVVEILGRAIMEAEKKGA